MRLVCGLVLAAGAIAATSVNAQDGRPSGGKIVGGSAASHQAWPGLAALRHYAKAKDVARYFCGGTAIGKEWVLTAAHCLHRHLDGVQTKIDDNGTTLDARLQVVLGADDLRRVHKANVYDVVEVIIQPAYRARIEAALDLPDRQARAQAQDMIALYDGHDIALLRLSRPYRGTTARLSLSRQHDPAASGMRVSVAGFGKTSKAPSGWQLPRYAHRTRRGGTVLTGSATLLQTSVQTIGVGPYRQAHADSAGQGRQVLIGDGQICAGLDHGGKDSCNGNSGGPLSALGRDRRPYQVGVVSWGKLACASRQAYGIYTRVSHHADWIQKHTGPLRGVPADAVNTDTAKLSKSDIALALGQLKDLLGPAKGRVRIGIEGGNRVALGDKVRFKAESTIAGRLAIIDVNAAGEVLLIFPNTVFQGQFRGDIEADAAITVPLRGTGNAFRAVEPVGEGRLIALVVPETFDIERHLAGPTARTKGLQPVHEPTSYFMRFIRQIERAVIGRRSGNGALRGWAYAVVTYEIVR